MPPLGYGDPLQSASQPCMGNTLSPYDPRSPYAIPQRSSSHLPPPPHPTIESHTTPIHNPFPSRDIRYYGDQTTSYPPLRDDVQYHPGIQESGLAWRGIPLALVTPIMISIQPLQAQPNQDGYNPYHQPPPPPSQAGRSDDSADPYPG